MDDANLYRYASNNSVNGIDPLGLLTVLVHGTFSGPQTFNDAFRNAVALTFGETPVAWQWSGLDTDAARQLAGIKLARYLQRYEKEHPCESINIVAHSHGGNVAFIASRFVNINNLVVFGAPIGDYTPNIANIGNLTNVYSTGDWVQGVWGGSDFRLFGRDFGPANQALPEMGPIQNVQLQGFSHNRLHTAAAWNQIFR